jgi:hypothetical protein
LLGLAGITLLSAGLFTPARAQDPDDMKRAVARISLINGDVSVRRGDSDWVAGVVNAPLMADDRIATGPNSRAEIEFDSSNMIRIGGNAEIHLTALEYERYQLELVKGTSTFRVLRPSSVNIEVDTPSVSVRPSKAGAYRIAVNDAGETQVMSRAGDVEIYTPKGTQWVNAGQMMVARGNPADPEFQMVNATAYDEWDQWNDNRDKIFMRSTSSQYVDQSNSGIYGTEDLDANGSWVSVPDYGPVWRPTVDAGWAPYGCGRWVWEDWYGWTWLSCDTWGWAPYHYGRWFFAANYGWCWYPGMRGVRHFWSPALVGFFGWGGGGGFGFGFGHIGWVPLAPYEVFHPWWGRGLYGGGFGRNINITNVNVINGYRNARFTNGIHGMSVGDFQGGRFGSIGHYSGSQIGTVGAVRGAMPFAPSSSHMSFADRGASFTPRASQNTRFFTHQQPPAVQRVPMSQQTRAMASPAGQPGSRGGMNSPSASAPAARPSQNGPSGGFRRFGEPGPAGGNTAPRAAEGNTRPNPSLQNTRPPQSQSSGFQRFGQPGNTTPRYNAPQTNTRPESAPRYNAPSQSQQQPRYNNAPSQPRYNAPSPSYSAPRSAPAPSYSAPRSAPSGGGGGGGSRPSGGGSSGGHSSGGGHSGRH